MPKQSLNASSINKDVLQKEILKFTLSLYSNPLLSSKAVDFVIEKFSNFTDEEFIPFIQNELQKRIKAATDPETYGKILFILEESKNNFSRFSSEHKRLDIYQKESHFILPELFELGQKMYLFYLIALQKLKRNVFMQPTFHFKEHLNHFFSIPGLLQKP